MQGVGPATASAILEAFDPSIPFLSDEAQQAALGTKDYTGGLPDGKMRVLGACDALQPLAVLLRAVGMPLQSGIRCTGCDHDGPRAARPVPQQSRQCSSWRLPCAAKPSG